MGNIKNKPIIAVLVFITTAVIGYTGLAAADSNDPGSSGDPLVTKSFVEKYVQDYLSSQGGSGSLAWSVKKLGTGEEFIGKAGTEIIVRSGVAVVVDPSGGGVPDLTDGTNIVAGEVVDNNHLLSLPRSDGRGVHAVQPTIIMYRGY